MSLSSASNIAFSLPVFEMNGYFRYFFRYNLLLQETSNNSFWRQTNLLDSGRRNTKAALALAKADLSSLPEVKDYLPLKSNYQNSPIIIPA
jgi:hypothetical protein